MANPTNSDIYREIKEIKNNQSDMADLIKDHEQRIRNGENFQIAYEAAAKALIGSRPQRISSLDKDFVNIILKFITLMTALVGLTYVIVDKLVH